MSDLRSFVLRLLEFTHDAVYRYRYEDGTLLMANQGFVTLLGLDCKPIELVGRPLRDLLVYTETEGSVRRAIEAGGEIHGFEYHFRTRAGEDRWVLHDSFLTVEPVTGEKIVEAIAKDITARKKAELAHQTLAAELERRVRQRTAELEAANQELESFAFSVSHDLRSPLLGIEGLCRVLLEEHGGGLGEEGREILERIRGGSRKLASLVDELLSLSRITRCEMRHTRVELSAMARDIADELRRSEPGRNVAVTIQPDLEGEGDESLLRNVLYNLLANAFKFTRTRETALIEFGASGGGAGTTYYVKDNGVGFDPEQAGKLFVPFQRLHRAPEFPGNGIGLVSCRRALARHGGRIWAEAWPGMGACFSFTLGT